MAGSNDLPMSEKGINELLEMREFLKARGYEELAEAITSDLHQRGYYDVPRLCSCKHAVDPACPIHGGKS